MPNLARPAALFTVGYEGLVQAQLVELMSATRVDCVLDVRAIAASRKAGFSKTMLSHALVDAGIGYCHDRRLGTPKPGRQAARAGRISRMTEIFSAHMQTPDATAGLTAAVTTALQMRTCLLCFESRPHDCHRSILATMICAQTGQEIRHL